MKGEICNEQHISVLLINTMPPDNRLPTGKKQNKTSCMCVTSHCDE